MKKAVLLALLLGGCQTDSERDWADAQRMCQRSAPHEYKDCVEGNFRNLRILSSYTPPADQAPAPVYYPQSAAVPASDAPVLQNIIPQTVRCQSVAAGMGTVQTICR